jgi:hypothetical protein
VRDRRQGGSQGFPSGEKNSMSEINGGLERQLALKFSAKQLRTFW